MKFKTTKKSIKENSYYIIKASYCLLQDLLSYENEFAYSTRTEGWACDYYDINGVIISTGYAPIESKNVNVNYKMMKSYNDKAQHIRYNTKFKYETKKRKVQSLLNEFIKEAMK